MVMRDAMGPGRTARISSADTREQRRLNANAPKIENLRARITALFHPFLGQLALIVTLVFISAGLGVLPPLLTQRVFDEGLFPPGTTGPHLQTLATLVTLMVGIFVLSYTLGIWQTYLTSKVGNRVMGKLRVKLFKHMQNLDIGFFTHTRTGDIQSRLNNDVGGVAGVLTNTVTNVIGNTVAVAAAFIAMLVLSWQLTIVSFILMPLLVYVQRKVGVMRARLAAKTQQSLSEMAVITGETLSISGMLLTKTFSMQKAETERYAQENDRQTRLQVKQTMTGQVFFALVQIFISAVPALVYLASGIIIAANETTQTGITTAENTNQPWGFALTAGTIVAFTTVQSRLLFPLMALLRVALDLQTSQALFARIFELLDLQPKIRDNPDAQPAKAPTPGTTHITFQNVSFTYEKQTPHTPATPEQTAHNPHTPTSTTKNNTKPEQQHTLKNINFTVQTGEFAAFVGPSGAGKSTIINLIARLYDTTTGNVLYGDTNVCNLKQESLMREIGLVTQDPYLFHATITENLLYAKPDATETELHEACKQAHIHETITTFENGYNTIVGERGHRLSGGEKQRLAIARVLLKNPPLLLLDEATSALDTVNERAVQKALDSARAGRTVIAIAHRLSTIVHADHIYVLENGQITQNGTHKQLLQQNNGSYQKLYKQQL